MGRCFDLIFFVVLGGSLLLAQQTGKGLLNTLGYSPNAKLLIIHADDIGMAHSVNVASFEALEKGWVSSGSIMVPCPWFNEAAEFARRHSNLDLGLHLTLTAEWQNYRWGAVSHDAVHSLLDSEGYFPRTTEPLRKLANSSTAATEIAAQVAKARAAGIQVTHLDNHMGALSQSAGLFDAYVKLASSAHVPISFSQGEVKGYGDKVSGLKYLPMPVGIEPSNEQDLLNGYREVFRTLQPGVYIMIVHLGHDDDELKAIMRDEAGTAAGRQADYDLVSNPEFQHALADNNIKLIGWRDVARALPK